MVNLVFTRQNVCINDSCFFIHIDPVGPTNLSKVVKSFNGIYDLSILYIFVIGARNRRSSRNVRHRRH